MKRYISILFGFLVAINTGVIYAVDGDLDNTFGTQGRVVEGFEDSEDNANALVVRHDKKIVAGGTVGVLQGSAFAIAIFEPDGTLDDFTLVDQLVSDTSTDVITGLAVQPDNKVVAVGYSEQPMGTAPPITKFIVMRFNKDGSLDTETFNPNDPNHPGIVEVDFFGSTEARAMAVAFKRDGRIVAVGESQDTSLNPPNSNVFYAVAVLNPDGSLDNTFAAAGRRVYSNITPAGGVTNVSSAANAVAIQSIGDKDNIVLAGFGEQFGDFPFRFQIVRVTCDGNLDQTFNNTGVDQVIFNNSDNANEFAKGVDIYPDGKIVAVGTSVLNGQQDIVATRRQVNGGPDNTFDADGKVIYNPGNDALDGRALNIQNDLKILIAGIFTTITENPCQFLLVRLNENGTPDNTFGVNGQVLTDFNNIPPGNSSSKANAIALQEDGKIVLAGNVSLDEEDNDFGLARYINDNTDQDVIVPPTIDEPENLSNCNTPQPVYSGKAQNPSNITVYITPDGVSPAVEAGRIITTDDKNEWSFTPPAPLAPGKHIAQIVAEYKSGNMNMISDPVCCGVCLGPQSCISEAIREKYCSCIEVPIGC